MIRPALIPIHRRLAAPSRPTIGSRRSRWIVTTVLVIGAAVTVFPFIWMILGSFKSLAESNRFPPTLLPAVWEWQNYREAWVGPPGTLGRYLWNTIIIAGVGTAGQLVVCSLAAYALAVLRFPGSKTVFGLVLATMMVPSEISLIPNFITIRSFPLTGGNDLFGAGGTGLYNTYLGIVIPGMVGAFNIFLLRQAFRQIPIDLWEASQLDGSSTWTYFHQILLPLSKPALVTVAIFGFVARWNGLLWPLVITRTEELRPVQLAMIYYQGEFRTDFGVVMAASCIVTFPIILIFVLMQKQFIEGIGSTGLKG